MNFVRRLANGMKENSMKESQAGEAGAVSLADIITKKFWIVVGL